MNRQYKALLMDVDGTLLDFDRAEAAAFTKVLQKYGFVRRSGSFRSITKSIRNAGKHLKSDRWSATAFLLSGLNAFLAGMACP